MTTQNEKYRLTEEHATDSPKTKATSFGEYVGAAFAIGIGIINVLVTSAVASLFVAFGFAVSLYIAIQIIEFVAGITWMDAWIANGNLYKSCYLLTFVLMILEDLGVPHVPTFKRDFYRTFTVPH